MRTAPSLLHIIHAAARHWCKGLGRYAPGERSASVVLIPRFGDIVRRASTVVLADGFAVDTQTSVRFSLESADSNGFGAIGTDPVAAIVQVLKSGAD